MEILQLAGAVTILVAFIAAQAGRLSPHAPSYLVLNFVGSVVLAWIALDESDWGFLLLEGVWAIVSGWGLLRLLRGRPPAAAS